MNKRNEAKLNMFRTTESICNEFSAIFAANVAFTAAFNDLKTKIVEIQSAAQQDAVVTTGITVDKKVAKTNLCNTAAEIASVIYAYASTVGNNTLKSEVDFPVSKLMRLREEMIAPNCQNIHDKGVENLTALADYGITSAMLANLQTQIDKYTADTPKTRTAISKRKATGEAIDTLFEQTDEILKERMDKIIIVFKTAHPDFVAAYENARRFIEPPTTTTQLKGTVTGKSDSTPIKGAAVTAVFTGNRGGGETFYATTDAEGEYLIKPITHGRYTVTITAAGFAALETDDFDIKLGEVNHLDAEMVT